MNDPSSGPRVSDELAAIDRDYPGWHAWRSDGGRVWATHVSTNDEQLRGLPDATTLDAGTPELLRHEVARYVRRAASAA